MAGTSYLLDTNIIVAYFNRENAIRNRLAGISVYVPSIAIGELYYGAYKSGRVEKNIQQIRDFIQVSEIIQCDESAADWYGQIKKQLRAKGRPIPENDIWIAAMALQYDYILATRDNHFQEVEKLSTEVW
jgi:tRNA(fMet)-specific endonuclease VapC